MTGGELVALMLRAEGVDVVFGIIDGSYFGLYSSLVKHGIRLVSPRHETSAVHMAGAYARLTGKLGVCIASNGPGAANALPGIAVENGEGNRVLVLTSWRRGPIVGPDRGGTYQYFDQVAVTKPMTKWSGAATTFDRVAETLRRAFRISFRGRPGAVHVTIPENVLNGAADAEPAVWQPAQLSPRRAARPVGRHGARRGGAPRRGASTADPRRQRRRARRGDERRRGAGARPAGADHRELGRARRTRRATAQHDPDAAAADRRSAPRRRRRARPRHALR